MKHTRTSWLAAAGLAAVAAALWSSRRGSYRLSGRVVLITGGSRGLGLVLARQAVAEGARVAICARDADELERARQELAADGAEVLALARDLTSETEVRTLVAEVKQAFGPVDVLINNAGIITGGPLEHMEERDYQESMNTHFWAPLHAMHAVLPDMMSRREGRIVNVASLGGKVAVPHMAPYCASKFALVGLSEGFRSEMLRYGVHVTTVCPGLMRTGSARQAVVKGQHEKEFGWFMIADSLPGLTVSAEYAARSIWNACRRGDAELILGLPAKLLSLAHGLAPGTTINALSWINRALPDHAGDLGNVRQRGYQSESDVTRSWLTALTRKAEKQNNELGNHPAYPA
ncbi:SDR family oxidoreductase [Hymenobacter busanensis]|uniref:SDR family oxidoreductase n=1 Tax=Hymenobacter busanensis TaxID=2607656 RepID=A0A7L4ZXD2_9BACT|nr:SDR family oxidoreductase [Hymenobacter busanensis]KAA9327562.1 SDR family oxidoreductase [Hymenobacter busanensis]QHJ06100.1 SDR family NAD(P)-dependent oxidoreductase [Hymenobacter busanensis]